MPESFKEELLCRITLGETSPSGTKRLGPGSRFLATPGGGLNSKVENWPGQVFDSMEVFKNDFRVITMDQRNAIGGESIGPVQVNDPWGAFADDQLGLMDHLGIQEFLFIGYCIGGPFAMKLIERAPERVLAAVLCQPVGHASKTPDAMYDMGRDSWGPDLIAQRPDLTMETIEQYLHNLYRIQPDFMYSVSRDFARSCQTPILVMPDDTPAHSLEAAMDMVELAPKAEVTPYPWKEEAGLKAKDDRAGAGVPEGASASTGRPLRKDALRKVAGDGGFEPPLPDPESGVLPLD